MMHVMIKYFVALTSTSMNFLWNPIDETMNMTIKNYKN